MAENRANKSGLSLEAQQRMQAKYDVELERKIRHFFIEQTGKPLEPNEEGPAAFQKALKDGVRLCELINAIQPGSVKKVNTSAMVFKQMENINNFNTAIKAYGVDDSCTFQTADLVDNQDLATVQNAIWQLACTFKKKGGNTSLGVKMSDANKREFDEETLKAGQNVIGLQMGSNKGATQAGMTSMGTQRKL